MIGSNEAEFRQNAFAYLEPAVADGDAVRISTEHGNAVVMREVDDRGLMETLYLSSIPGMTDSILATKDEKTRDCCPYDPAGEW